MSSRYTRSAKGKQCSVRYFGCTHDPETTVAAHLNGAGMGRKRSDIHIAYADHACHFFLDQGYVALPEKITITRAEFREYLHLKAIIETQQQMIRDGILIL